MDHSAQQVLTLPTAVVGRVDIGRLLREVEALDSFLEQAAVRQPGTPVKMPKTSKFFDEIVTSNKLNVLVDADRKRLTEFLKSVRNKAPMMHMSFSADPSPLFMQKLITYLRREIHPLVLVQIGMQPTIGAGCVVRTTNKYFDFSLRQHLMGKKKELMDSIMKVAPKEEPKEVTAPNQTATTAAAPAASEPAASVPDPAVKPAETVPAEAPGEVSA